MGVPVPGELSLHVLRARRTAATARALLALCGIGALLLEGSLSPHPRLATLGFVVILVTASVELLAPARGWLAWEEAIATTAGVLIVGLSDERVTVLSVLWLSAVASGVLARGGRVHWLGRLLLLGALALPIARGLRVQFDYGGLCLAAIVLLLTCGRLTRELNHLLTRARYAADHDSLTDVLSRAAFRDQLDHAASTATAEAALLVIDLQRFRQVNKFAGHAAGDALLRSVADRLVEAAEGRWLVGRLGGDEFAAVLDGGDPLAVAEQMLARLAEDDGSGRAVQASVGVARIPRDGRDADSLLRAADVALRVAKQSAGGRVAMYSGGSLTDEGPGGAREALGRLIDGDGITTVVQPIVDVRSGIVHAYEALSRFGADGPLQWFALADELGRRPELELACLRSALALTGDLPAGARLSVNLSGPLLLDPRAQEMLNAQPRPDALIIEITEEALVENDARLHAAVSPLMDRGLVFAVDDLGAGYSGLRQIISMRPAYLKLDRTLVNGIDADGGRAALISALIVYAKSAASTIVAEGVETAAELHTLVTLGVPLVQGYYLGRPAAPWPAVEHEPRPRTATPPPSLLGTPVRAAGA